MTHRRQKLELTWIGKESRPRLEPLILLEDRARGCHVPHCISANDRFNNRLIFVDNLLALKQSQQWQNCRSSATTICNRTYEESILMEVSQ
jgi:adenine-specific DNA-methyltransferase